MCIRDRRIEVDNVYDTVEQEIKVVREYLLIQKYRYTGIFKSVIDIEAGVEPYLIAKNILQPLVAVSYTHLRVQQIILLPINSWILILKTAQKLLSM